jgi:ankyrin repeat protein
MAAFAGDWIVIECLTHFGANTELVNSEGDTPLHLATKCNDWLRVYHVMDQLCLSGARTEAEDSSGLTALGLILNRVEGETQALLMPRSSRAENCIYILLVERRANASHPSVKRPLEILMARKDLPNIFGILAEFHSEYKAREGIVL